MSTLHCETCEKQQQQKTYAKSLFKCTSFKLVDKNFYHCMLKADMKWFGAMQCTSLGRFQKLRSKYVFDFFFSFKYADATAGCSI